MYVLNNKVKDKILSYLTKNPIFIQKRSEQRNLTNLLFYRAKLHLNGNEILLQGFHWRNRVYKVHFNIIEMFSDVS